MSHRVVFSPEVQEQLVQIYRYIAEAASADISAQNTEAIVSYCESLRTFPPPRNTTGRRAARLAGGKVGGLAQGQVGALGGTAIF